MKEPPASCRGQQGAQLWNAVPGRCLSLSSSLPVRTGPGTPVGGSDTASLKAGVGGGGLSVPSGKTRSRFPQFGFGMHGKAEIRLDVPSPVCSQLQGAPHKAAGGHSPVFTASASGEVHKVLEHGAKTTPEATVRLFAPGLCIPRDVQHPLAEPRAVLALAARRNPAGIVRLNQHLLKKAAETLRRIQLPHELRVTLPSTRALVPKKASICPRPSRDGRTRRGQTDPLLWERRSGRTEGEPQLASKAFSHL